MTFKARVIAQVGIIPQAPTGSNIILNAYPKFTIAKVDEVGGGGLLFPFNRTLQSEGLTDVHLPNGQYQARMWMQGYNQNLPPLQPLGPTGVPYDDGSPNSRVAGMTIAYDIDDTSGNVMNYSLAGVRVKKITTTDQYSNVTNTRTFIYHNPVNDSSYGAFIGSALNDYVETTQEGQWQVIEGSYNMPGLGTNSANVVYPKVVEDVNDNGVTYRTEHYFSRGVGIFPLYSTSFPFVPSLDVENARGNEYKTIWDKQFNANFTVAKMRQQVFDSFPRSQASPHNYFGYKLFGIKCQAATYDQPIVLTNGYAPPYVTIYDINVNNRTYLTSDSTITYDLVNPNNGIKEWHDYTYGDYNHKPLITRSGNSDGTINIEKNYYDSDQPEPNTELNAEPTAQLIAANRLDVPLGTKQYKNTQLLSQQYTYTRFDGDKLLIDSMRQSIFSNPLDVEVKVIQYDDYANPLTIALRGDKYRKYIWNKDKGLPLATCVSSMNDPFYYSSFEYNGDGGVSGNAFAGTRAFQLSAGNNITIASTRNNLHEDIYVWATSSDIHVNGLNFTSTNKTKGLWTLYKCNYIGDFNDANPIIITGTALIDQLIVMPVGALFQGNVYDSSNRVIASVNDQILTNFYEYDPFGRLTIVRDEQGNILKSTTYQYQAAQ
jgi:YD repeat-containing protein